MTWTDITETFQQWTQPAYLYAGGALLALIILYRIKKHLQPKNVVAYKTADGNVMVSRAAIVELVRSTCDQIHEVSKPRIKIRIKGKYTHIDVSVKLIEGSLRSLDQTLQAHLRHGLTENLGLEHLGKINIIATGFKSSPIEQTPPSSTLELPATAPQTDDTLTEDDDTTEEDEVTEPDTLILEAELEEKKL